MIEFIENHLFNATISFSNDVVQELDKHKQGCGRKETGGMLFSRDLESPTTVIDAISSAGDLDQRGRYFFKQNGKAAQRIVNDMFEAGLHYVGDWHTHPDVDPSPSGKDLNTIRSIFKESEHNLRYMVHLILSSSGDVSKSFVAITDGINVQQCLPILE